MNGGEAPESGHRLKASVGVKCGRSWTASAGNDAAPRDDPNCAGASSATKELKQELGLEAGEAFITTWRSASRPTVSWSPNGV